MSKQVKLPSNYITTLASQVPITSTGEIAVALNDEFNDREYEGMGFIIIDRDDNLKAERMFFHRKNGSTVYVYSVNRRNPKAHSVGANVIIDHVGSINYAIDTGFPQMYIYKKSNKDVIITGGEFFINSDRVTLQDFDTSTGNYFTPGIANNVYIKDKQYFITTEDRNDLYLVGKIYVDTMGNIEGFDMARTLSIGDGMRQEERDKLASINPEEYEKKANKTTDVRPYSSASDTLYPTEKAVAYKLDGKVDKVDGKGLSDKNFEQWEKDFIRRLSLLGLEDLDFSKMHNLRQDLRDYLIASNKEAVSEKGIAKVLMNYVKSEEGKKLTTNDFTDRYKEIIDSLYRDRANFVLWSDVKDTLSTTNPSSEKVPTEKAVVTYLRNYVKKDGNKTLTDVNFTQEMLDKLNSLENRDKIKVTAGTGIDVVDLGEEGYRVSSSIETGTHVIGGNINIFPLENAKTKYIDEQKYIVLSDTQRSGFYGEATFKNGKNPTIKVYYNNNKGAGKIMIDTHIRVIKSDGTISEKHKTVPYDVDLVDGHGVFELKPQSFKGLDYADAEVIYIKVFRVGSYYTDKYGNEFNTVLNDLDTIDGDVRFKSMYITYEVAGETTFSGTLYDTNCQPIATIENGLITKPNNINPNDNNTLLSVSTNAIVEDGFVTNRDLSEDNVDEDTVLSWVATLVKDMKDLKALKNSVKGDLLTEFNKLKVINPKDDNLLQLDGDNSSINNITSFLYSLVNITGEALKSNGNINSCNGEPLNLEYIEEENQVKYTVTGNDTREIDVEVATLEEYRDFVRTLIGDIKDTGLFTGEYNEYYEKKEYVIRNADGSDNLNLNSSLNDLGNFLFTFVVDMKKTNII